MTVITLLSVKCAEWEHIKRERLEADDVYKRRIVDTAVAVVSEALTTYRRERAFTPFDRTPTDDLRDIVESVASAANIDSAELRAQCELQGVR